MAAAMVDLEPSHVASPPVLEGRVNAEERAAIKRLISNRRIELVRRPGECWWCFEPFEGRSHQRYCSKACRTKAYVYRRAAA